MKPQLSADECKQVLSRAKMLCTDEEVCQALKRMAREISTELADANPVVLCTMVGGVVPTGLLMQAMDIPLQLDYIQATRYREDFVGKDLEWRVTPKVDLKDRTVLVIDDILDGGITLAGITQFCEQAGAKKVYTAVMVEKQTARSAGGVHKADFTGVKVEDRFVFGYGLDYKGFLRNAPGIYAAAEEDI